MTEQASHRLPVRSPTHETITQWCQTIPPDLLANLIDLSDGSHHPKLVYDSTKGNVPTAVRELMHVSHDLLDVPANTAVMKRYDKFDPTIAFTAKAYTRNAFPHQYANSQVALVSLSGEVIFTAFPNAGKIQSFTCRPNTTLVLPGAIEHRVTPPLNPDGVRHVVFLGSACKI